MQSSFYDPGNPQTTAAIVSCITELQQKAFEMFSGMTAGDFFARPASGWSAAENVEHLIKTTWPVTLALKLPKTVLRLLFGKKPGPQRSFLEIRDAYYKSLTTGRAGVLAPARVLAGASAAEKRNGMLERFKFVKLNLIHTVQSISEDDLDLIQLPHPSIGRVSMREMVLTTINHDIHHLTFVHSRRSGLS